MKKIIIPFSFALLLIAGCKESVHDGGADNEAVNNARRYFRTNLGGDTVQYEEIKWGAIEPYAIDFEKSKTYRMYQDTLVILNARLTELNDSALAEFTMKGDSPLYKTFMMRKTALEQEVKLYGEAEAGLRERYVRSPEYEGYWIYHEYSINGQPKKAYILFRDTASYEPVQVIYK